MQVVTEHRKADDIQSEDPSRFFQPFPDPLFPVGVVFAGTAILTTKKCAPNTAIDQMERLNLILRTNLRSFDPRHRSSPCPNTHILIVWSHDLRVGSLFTDCVYISKVGRTVASLRSKGWVARIFLRFQRYCGLSVSRNRSFLGHRFTSSTKACIKGSIRLGK